MSDVFANRSSAADLRLLIEGSACFGCDFSQWEARRRFAASTITHSGSILDVGCANGFFLWCIKHWCAPLELVPFGLDISRQMIDSAHRLFYEDQNSFQTGNLFNLTENRPSHWPQKFDYVYCSLLGPGGVTDLALEMLIKDLLYFVRPTGRLILGLYVSQLAGVAAGARRVGEAKIAIDTRIKEIVNAVSVCGYLQNEADEGQAVVWIDQQPSPNRASS